MNRLKTSEQSVMLAIQMIAAQWKDSQARRKLPKTELEEKIMVAALACD